jgi:hypothetical protein
VYAPATCTALVFDPPIAANEPRIDIPREARERGAFWGYEETTATYFYLRIDDHQNESCGHRQDTYERQAISERVGVSYR